MRTAAGAVAAAALCCVAANAEALADKPVFTPTSIKGHFVEQFTESWSSRWSPSEATKETSSGGETFSYVGKWEVEEPTVYPGIAGDKGLVVKSKAAHHAISVPFSETLDNTDKTLVVQYEVKLQKGLECGGAYLKLLKVSPTGIQAQEFSDKTEYSIMFGPDRCGGTNKVHFIFRHKNPLTGEYEEKHLKNAPAIKNTKTTALYTLIVKPDQTYEIKVNDESKKSGSLLDDFDPPVNPPKEIDDPEDKKPGDWVDQAKISDPEASKPEDWDEDAPLEILDDEAEKPAGWLDDEPHSIPDPDAEKPEEWDDEEDGDWVPPSVPNPKCEDAPGCGPWARPTKPNPAYKGKWYAPLIDNPLYKGVWAPRKISNPKHYEDKSPANFEPIEGLGIELWTMQEDILFDNIYIGHSVSDAEAFAKETFHVKEPIEKELEDKDKPAPPPPSPDSIPESFQADPVQFVRGHVQRFIDGAVVDPVQAIKDMPAVAGGLGVAFLTLLGMLSALVGLFSPSKAQVQQAKDAVAKKTDAVVADDTVDSGDKPVAESLKEAPIAGEKDKVEAHDLRKRK